MVEIEIQIAHRILPIEISILKPLRVYHLLDRWINIFTKKGDRASSVAF